MTCFRYLLTNTLFLTGQWSSFVMFAISFPLSLFSLSQSCNRCYTFWVPLPQGHSGESIILNRCKYDLVFPCAVTIAVKLGVKVIFIFSLSLIFWEKFFGHSSFCSVVPKLLPLFYAYLFASSRWV